MASYAALGDSISFHGWDGNPTSAMTAAQYRADTAKAVKWLQSRRYAGRMWRAAVVNNLAAAGNAIRDLVLAQASYTSNGSSTPWPPLNRYDIPRYGFYNATAANTNAVFALMQLTHQSLVVFNHGIHTDGGNDATPALFDNFMDRAEEGIAAGWLEFTTFEELWLESGGQWGDVSGATTAQFIEGGSVVTRQYL